MGTAVEKQHGKAKAHRRIETEGIGSPISNEAYNVIAALHAKLEGLEAYRKYAKDGNPRVWRELSRTEAQTVSKLVDELERLVDEGKFRMGEPGETGH
jgi:hypothetical protein